MASHAMILTLRKNPDGSTILHVTRADGSTDWQKQGGRNAAFFALHDLTHYAVETELGITDAFYGLLSSGWSIRDTEGKSVRGPLPAAALFVEAVVGTLDSERASCSRWTAQEFNGSLETHLRRMGRVPPRLLTDGDLARIRSLRSELFDRWKKLPAGGTLELSFQASQQGEASNR